MKKSVRLTFCFLLVVLSFETICAQSSDASLSSALEQKRTAVESDPESLDAHKAYLRSFSRKDSLTVNKQYALWMQRFPTSAIVPFAVAKFYYSHENPQARSYLLKAVANKPDFAEAWNRLSVDALFWGNYKWVVEYAEKAALADRTNADYAYTLLLYLDDRQKVKRDSLSLDLVLRFPDHNRAAMVLANLAASEKNQVVKVGYYEQLYTRFSESQPDGFKSGMSGYFSYLIESGSPDKAYTLALKMILDKQKRNGLEWKFKIKMARCYMDLKDLLDAKKYEEALTVLEEIKFHDHLSASYVSSSEKLLLLNAEVRNLAGKTQLAYDSLAVYYSKYPSDEVRKPMLAYASKLGMGSDKVDHHVWTLREAKALPADNFTLTEFGTSKKVSLSDYKGKVVLLTYWFPGCGPCRAEFPHFENVLKKFSKDQVVYLGINGLPEQDGFVIPFMKASGYSFVSLKEDLNRDRGNLIARSYPANYLIDQKGRIVHSKFQISSEVAEHRLELMIAELLNPKAK